MTAETTSSSRLPKGVVYGLGLAALWMVLALVSPTTTYHLASLIVAGTPVVVDAQERRNSMSRLVRLAAVGLGLALVVTGILSVSGNLGGPSLLPTGGAALESVVFGVAGSIIGLVAAVWVDRR